MELSDEKIKDILATKDTTPITVPSWSDISVGVRKQNFFNFGFLHINIYSISIALTIILLSGYFIKQSMNIPQDNFDNKLNLPVSDSIENTNLHNSNSEAENIKGSSVIERPRFNSNSSNQDVPDNSLKSEVKENDFVNDIPFEENMLPKDSVKSIDIVEPESKPVKKGKTFIVYQTDTIVETDTLVVDKKIRNK